MSVSPLRAVHSTISTLVPDAFESVRRTRPFSGGGSGGGGAGGVTGEGNSLPVPLSSTSAVSVGPIPVASVDAASRNRFSRMPVNGARTVPAMASVSAAGSKSAAAGVASAQRVPSATDVKPSAESPLFWRLCCTAFGVSTGIVMIDHSGS